MVRLLPEVSSVLLLSAQEKLSETGRLAPARPRKVDWKKRRPKAEGLSFGPLSKKTQSEVLKLEKSSTCLQRCHSPDISFKM